jgi:ATP-dependent Clp protease adaptor protein ClpS
MSVSRPPVFGDDDHPVLGDIGLDDDNVGTVLERTPSRQKAKPPPQFAVIMLNDDFTPVDFVVAVLVDIFRKPMDEAEAIPMDVHKKGKGVAGIYTKDIAETKVTQVHRVAHEHQHPFRCNIQPV